jgi:hypothetical protein
VVARLLKLLHFASLAGFVGGLVAARVLSSFADGAPPTALAALRLSIAHLGAELMVPSLIVLLLSGMLLVVARPHLINARWIWAKAVLSVAMAGAALAIVQPAMTRSAGFAAAAALGTPAPLEIALALEAEARGGAVVLLLAALAVLLAVWRPRLGQRSGDAGDEGGSER